MHIEVLHDGAMLPHKRQLKVKNLKAATEYLMTAVESRLSRGLRVRIMPDVPSGTLRLETRNSIAMTTALALLRQGGWLCR